MSDYIEVEKKIYIPLKPVTVKFHEKEEVELNAFQYFILEAVEDHATVDQMIEATQLTKNVIESELLHMENQKLLTREGGIVVLSELSKNILMISRTVEMLNEEKKIMCVNLISGDMEGYEEEIYQVEEKELVLREKIRSNDVVGINIEDNVSFLADYMSAFDKLTEEQIDTVLSSVYVEFYDTDKKVIYKERKVYKLPCLIGDDQLTFEENVYAEGKCSVITLKASTDQVEKYEGQIESVLQLYTDAPELFSDLASDLVKEYRYCEKCNKDNLTFVYDHESGRISEKIYDTTEPLNKRTQLMLKSEKKIDADVEKQIFTVAKEKWKLDEKYFVKITSIKEQNYKIGFCLEELGGDIYADK